MVWASCTFGFEAILRVGYLGMQHTTGSWRCMCSTLHQSATKTQRTVNHHVRERQSWSSIRSRCSTPNVPVHWEKPPSMTLVHACVLHGAVISRSTGQAAPPNRGGTQVRVDTVTPPPHDSEQSLLVDQLDTTASMGCGGTSQCSPVYPLVESHTHCPSTHTPLTVQDTPAHVSLASVSTCTSKPNDQVYTIQQMNHSDCK